MFHLMLFLSQNSDLEKANRTEDHQPRLHPTVPKQGENSRLGDGGQIQLRDLQASLQLQGRSKVKLGSQPTGQSPGQGPSPALAVP